MKLIITGASGLVASELLAQSLKRQEITSVIAVARKPVTAPPGVDGSKLRSVVIEDYERYPEDLRREFAGADACIWTVAITPSKAKGFPFDEVTRVCHTSALACLQALHDSGPNRPLRFVFVSGIGGERDQTKTPKMFPEYCLMRGRTESAVLEFAASHKGEVIASVAKPGFITGGGGVMRGVMGTAMAISGLVPTVGIKEVSAALLEMALGKSDAETLLSDDLAAVGREALKRDESQT